MKHPKAGRPVKVTKGPFKDKYVVVVDFLTNQFQGKDVKNIDKGHPNLTRDIKKRGLLDDKAVFVRLYPSMEHVVIHDTEIQIEKEKTSLKAIKGGKDDTTRSSDGDNQDAESGGHESDGRSVSGDEDLTEVPSPFTKNDEPDSTSGGGADGDEEESEGHDKPKARSTKRTSPAKKGSKAKK